MVGEETPVYNCGLGGSACRTLTARKKHPPRYQLFFYTKKMFPGRFNKYTRRFNPLTDRLSIPGHICLKDLGPNFGLKIVEEPLQQVSVEDGAPGECMAISEDFSTKKLVESFPWRIDVNTSEGRLTDHTFSRMIQDVHGLWAQRVSAETLVPNCPNERYRVGNTAPIQGLLCPECRSCERTPSFDKSLCSHLNELGQISECLPDDWIKDPFWYEDTRYGMLAFEAEFEEIPYAPGFPDQGGEAAAFLRSVPEETMRECELHWMQRDVEGRLTYTEKRVRDHLLAVRPWQVTEGKHGEPTIAHKLLARVQLVIANRIKHMYAQYVSYKAHESVAEHLTEFLNAKFTVGKCCACDNALPEGRLFVVPPRGADHEYNSNTDGCIEFVCGTNHPFLRPELEFGSRKSAVEEGSHWSGKTKYATQSDGLFFDDRAIAEKFFAFVAVTENRHPVFYVPPGSGRYYRKRMANVLVHMNIVFGGKRLGRNVLDNHRGR